MKKMVPKRKIKMHAITIPAMAPECNDDDDAEKDLVFCDKEVPEDVEGDEVDGKWDVDDADGGIIEAGVDIWDSREFVPLLVTVVMVVMVNDRLDRL
jgi:hypothetical protein